MSDETQIQQLAELFKKTGQAHHQAFIKTDGEDPDWPIWYASYLCDRLTPFLAAPITRGRLVFCLVATDDEHRATDPDAPWPEYYAKRVLECLGPTEEPNTDRLALYYIDGCPFCVRVRGVIGELGLDVELRNIYENSTRLEELREARGRTTVPVLRITSADGEDRWMPESADIIRYLQASYGRVAA
ncbi:MAG: glutathione S-transferase N-terminal domain-containing protein [Deltaproteobacteria bacterium]|nr:glutathione S-transferase N-terminal domain-containing protein [Deltaproteobacteria bacterium]